MIRVPAQAEQPEPAVVEPASASGRQVAWCALGLACFLAVGAVVRLALPWPWFDVTAKLQALEAASPDEPPIHAVFIGNSRVLHGVNPVAFDDRLAALGILMRSVNLGGPGMGPWEADHVLDWVLGKPPKGLRYVFQQVGQFDPSMEERELRTERTIYWHDVERTMGAIRSAWIQPRISKAAAWRWTMLHGGYFLRWMTSYGLGMAAIRPSESPRRLTACTG